ncbi:MAG: pyridoxal phosphate-dependent aminotransferase [Candidatus Eremiobacteraeota bacterium]|nr:pyridoxal phosphate-dependent aminotransferase [Candidatus Eremiobacteraeota bacterium]
MNPRVSALAPSGIRALAERKRPTSIDLSVGQPGLPPDIGPFETATDWVRRNGCLYPPYCGVEQLRQKVANVYGGPLFAGAENVCVTNGAQEAIYIAIKTLVDPRAGEVLVLNPGYPSYARCCELEGIAWRPIGLDASGGFALTAAAVLAAVGPATRLIIIGSPSNPTGAVMAPTEVDELGRGLISLGDAAPWVIFDEVYRELSYEDAPFRSITTTYPKSMSVQSLSKSCAVTGLRIGFLIGPTEVIERATRVHALMLMSISVFGQQVALGMLRSTATLGSHRPYYQAQRQVMRAAARGAAIEFVDPQGAFYTLVRLSPSWHGRSHQAAVHLLEQYDVVTVAGDVFGSATSDYLRVTWSGSAADVREGFDRIGRFLSREG